jgi:arylsulfatase A-like enzyme
MRGIKKMERKNKNVILITIDSLRADHLGCFGYSRNTSPNLDNLAKEGILFLQAISNGPGTRQSFQSILTSTYPLMYGGYEYLSDKRTTIAEVLKENRYSTAAFHSNPFLSRFYGYDRGFDMFDDNIGVKGLGLNDAKQKIIDKLRTYKKLFVIIKSMYYFFKGGELPHATADMINRKAITWMKTNPDKFFVWLHYMDVHNPFVPPYNHLRQFHAHHISRRGMFKLNNKMFNKPNKISKDELKTLIDLYDGEIRYLDDAIGSFLNELKETGILDSTIIIVTSDHGEEFKEHGGLGHGPKLYDVSLHVPLIVYIPEFMDKNAAIKNLVSLLDIPPTILDLIGIQQNENFQGTTLVPIIMGQQKSSGVISEVSHGENSLKIDPTKRKISYRTENWKYIHDEENNRRELYDLQSDPNETKNLIAREREKAKEFESVIVDHISIIESKSGLTFLEKEKIKKLKKLRKI